MKSTERVETHLQSHLKCPALHHFPCSWNRVIGACLSLCLLLHPSILFSLCGIMTRLHKCSWSRALSPWHLALLIMQAWKSRGTTNTTTGSKCSQPRFPHIIVSVQKRIPEINTAINHRLHHDILQNNSSWTNSHIDSMHPHWCVYIVIKTSQSWRNYLWMSLILVRTPVEGVS